METFEPWQHVGFTLWRRKSLSRNHYQYIASSRQPKEEWGQ